MSLLRRSQMQPKSGRRALSVSARDGTRLIVDGLGVGYGPLAHQQPVVAGVSLELRAGEILGLVGETGCGKSTTALAAIGYRGRGAVVTEGKSWFDGTDILQLGSESLSRVWGSRIAFIPQNAGTSLNPTMRAGTHFVESLRRHHGLTRSAARARAVELLEAVGIDDPPEALRKYPHQFSGGQQQRLSLALALACEPDLLVLDEPTTGLDVQTQARVSQLLRRLVDDSGVAALYVSHDIALLSTLAERICVMYAGQVVEEARTSQLLRDPRHPYTRALLAAVPSLHTARQLEGIPGGPPARVVADGCAFAPRCGYVSTRCTDGVPPLVIEDGGHSVRCVRRAAVQREARSARTATVTAVVDRAERAADEEILLEVRDLTCAYGTPTGQLVAVRDVGFSVARGETLGVIGLSGSGKSTMLRALAGLQPYQGEVVLDGTVLAPVAAHRDREVRRSMQLVFQDPGSSLNPRHTVEQLVGRPLEMFRPELDRVGRQERLVELMDSVRLPRSLLTRYPWELSGGQQQRVAIARAFAPDPQMLLCDEVTSSLDVSVQARVLELLRELAHRSGTSVVFVSHDLAVVRSIARRAVVMLQGSVIESGQIDDIFANPTHPYTIELLEAVPEIEVST